MATDKQSITVSELIIHLVTILKEHGDVPVYGWNAGADEPAAIVDLDDISYEPQRNVIQIY